MATVHSNDVSDGEAEDDSSVAELRGELASCRRRLEATVEWADFLEQELEDRNDLLDAVIHQYEAQLQAVGEDDRDGRGDGGALASLRTRLAALF